MKLSPCRAHAPWQMRPFDYWIVAKNIWRELNNDNVAIVAAGVAFFTMLAIFPFITACLSIYGYFADPHVVQDQLTELSRFLPPESWAVINRQIMSVVNAPESNLGFGIIIGLVLALWSAGAGIRAMMRAMNIAYEEKEQRNILKFYGLASLFTFCVSIIVWVSLLVIIGVPALLSFLRLDGVISEVMRVVPWIIMALIFFIATGVLYRYGPNRRPAKIVWLLPGMVFASISWLVISAGFSAFVTEFGNYNRTYGSLSAAIVLLIWFWLTALVVIVGAEINAELERYTQIDTTIGPDRPVGERGSYVADYNQFPEA